MQIILFLFGHILLCDAKISSTFLAYKLFFLYLYNYQIYLLKMVSTSFLFIFLTALHSKWTIFNLPPIHCNIIAQMNGPV
jgi:hypothetical protein